MRQSNGFTLIELLLVLAIIGIISAIAIPALLGQRQSARNNATASNATNLAAVLQNALDMCEKPQTDRSAGDMATLPDNPTATQVVTLVMDRLEFQVDPGGIRRFKNPFTNGPAYKMGAPTVPGQVGVLLVVENGQCVANISYGIQTSAGLGVVRLPKSPETSLRP